MKISILSIVLLACISVILCHPNNTIEFNRDLVSVLFDPRLFPEDIGDEYGEEDLTKMVSTIASRFSKVMLESMPLNLKPSLALVPNTIAKFNKNQKKNQRQMEVVLNYQPHIKENVHTNFEFIKKLGNDANSLYNGTVSTILLDNTFNYLGDNLQNIISSLVHARRQIRSGSFNYKLGLHSHISDCDDVEILKEVLNYTDTLIFHRWTVDADHKFRINAHLDWVVEDLERCRLIVKKLGKPIKVGFMVQRSDTPLGGSQSLEDFVTFWKHMSHWAETTNTSIILYEAFDAPRKPAYQYCGWWRGKNGENGALLDFTLEEKATVLIEHGSSPLKRKSFTNFSRKNVMVVFEPWVLPPGFPIKRKYDNSALSNMIDKISSRFSKVVLTEVFHSSYNMKSPETLLASAVARWNQNRTSNNPSPMEGMMLSVLNLSGNLSTELDTFDVTKSLADEANSIYPGTITTILTTTLTYDTDNISSLHWGSQLILSRNKIADTEHPYKLGMYLSLSTCGEFKPTLQPALIPLLPLVDVVIFEKFPSSWQHSQGVEFSFPLIFKEFERCVKKVHKINKDVNIGFSTWWQGMQVNGTQNISALVDFWERANDWAVTINASVVLWDAFDNFNRDNAMDRTQGWWTLDTSRTYEHLSELVFLEKAEEIKSDTSFRDLNSKNPSELETLMTVLDTTSVVIIAVASVVLILLCIGISGVIMYKRILKQVKAKALTKNEIRHFFDGGTSTTEGDSSLNICSMPYDKDLEISKDAFTIDESSVLGTGIFGVVCKAVILTDGEKEAAVKMTMESSPSTAVKNLLSEVKILSYVGQHENIVGIIGANTAEILKGKVYVFFELCPNGSLESYLKTYNPEHESTKNSVDEDAQSLIDLELTEVRETGIAFEIQKWTLEIASGMEFLAEKHVVHGDLATRNVLLTENKSVKISDFGLSRRMYNYTNYLKQQIGEPLPWRWMAPESFRRLEFGEKTDVWAFGVTLWEMFSLGDIPYPGLEWSTEFPTKIEEGLRCDKPRRASSEMYEIMKACWDPIPRKRPSFFELKEKFSKKLLESISIPNQQ